MTETEAAAIGAQADEAYDASEHPVITEEVAAQIRQRLTRKSPEVAEGSDAA